MIKIKATTIDINVYVHWETTGFTISLNNLDCYL